MLPPQGSPLHVAPEQAMRAMPSSERLSVRERMIRSFLGREMYGGRDHENSPELPGGKAERGRPGQAFDESTVTSGLNLWEVRIQARISDAAPLESP